MKLELIVAGVGGQGSILASHLIADAAIAYGERTGEQVTVRVGETFGAAMRGGAVASHVHIGKVEGPLVAQSRADVVLALEPLEGLRIGAQYLGQGGLALLNTSPIPPLDAKTGAALYPTREAIEEALKALGAKVLWVDGTAIATTAGDLRTMNVAMVGALFGSGLLPVGEEDLIKVIRERVPPKTIDKNLKAFQLGQAAGAGLGPPRPSATRWS